MFTNMHIAKANATESKIEMELLFLSESTQAACLELIMSLEAEDRITYLNQFMQKVAAMTADVVANPADKMEWLLAAWFPHNKKVLTLFWDGLCHLFLFYGFKMAQDLPINGSKLSLHGEKRKILDDAYGFAHIFVSDWAMSVAMLVRENWKDADWDEIFHMNTGV